MTSAHMMGVLLGAAGRPLTPAEVTGLMDYLAALAAVVNAAGLQARVLALLPAPVSAPDPAPESGPLPLWAWALGCALG